MCVQFYNRNCGNMLEQTRAAAAAAYVPPMNNIFILWAEDINMVWSHTHTHTHTRICAALKTFAQPAYIYIGSDLIYASVQCLWLFPTRDCVVVFRCTSARNSYLRTYERSQREIYVLCTKDEYVSKRVEGIAQHRLLIYDIIILNMRRKCVPRAYCMREYSSYDTWTVKY